MIAAIASGKGSIGKTTVTASLATVWDGPLLAVDLDVEEPNLHLFLRPAIDGSEKACMTVPVVNESRCTYCGACSELCQYKAISVINQLVLTFPEMCHGCGGCLAVCPEKAISAGRRELGEISWGQAGAAGFLMGRLRIGEAMSPPSCARSRAGLTGCWPPAEAMPSTSWRNCGESSDKRHDSHVIPGVPVQSQPV